MPLGIEARSHACQRRFGRQRQSGSPVPPHPSPLPKGEGATRVKSEGRRSKAERRPKPEGRRPNRPRPSGFGFRNSAFFRPSAFGRRTSKLPPPLLPRSRGGRRRAPGRRRCQSERRIHPAAQVRLARLPVKSGVPVAVPGCAQVGAHLNSHTSSPDLINTPLQRGAVRVRWQETVLTVSWLRCRNGAFNDPSCLNIADQEAHLSSWWSDTSDRWPAD